MVVVLCRFVCRAAGVGAEPAALLWRRMPDPELDWEQNQPLSGQSDK
jgi:hypothetical protein